MFNFKSYTHKIWNDSKCYEGRRTSNYQLPVPDIIPIYTHHRLDGIQRSKLSQNFILFFNFTFAIKNTIITKPMTEGATTFDACSPIHPRISSTRTHTHALCNYMTYATFTRVRGLLGGFGGGCCCCCCCWRGPLVYVALERRPSAVAHVKRMRVPERRQPTESGERGQVPFAVSVVAHGSGRVERRRGRGHPRRGRSESAGHPSAARQRTCTRTIS